MKNHLLAIGDAFRALGTMLRNALRAVGSAFSCLFSKKETRNYFIGFGLTLILFTASCCAMCSYMPNNIVQTISESVESYRHDKNKNPAGIVTPVDMVSGGAEMTAIPAESRKKLNNIADVRAYWNVYPATMEPVYSPVVIKDSEQNEKKYSMVLSVKDAFANAEFDERYNIPLLCGGTGRGANVEDLYLNTEYASVLLKEKSLTKFEDLLGKQISLPYENKVGSYELIYTIRGVMDDTSSQYQSLRKYFGDFFMGDEYLNLPLPWVTFYEFGDDAYENYTLIRNVNSIYSYDVKLKRYNALSNEMRYDFRMFILDELGTDCSIDIVRVNEYNVKLQKAYDVYFSRQYVIMIIIFLSLSVAAAIGMGFLYRKFLLSYASDASSGFAAYFATFLGLTLVLATLGVLFAHLLGRITPLLSVLSMNSFIAYILIIATLVVLSFFAIRVYHLRRGKILDGQIGGNYHI